MSHSVTVLIAVFNAEPYLARCLDSLLAQSMTSWQAVCVDDASTDGSAQLLRQYAGRDSRFRVIRLDKNQGQAHARNVALQQADGDLTCFLDADDWFSPDALQQAVGQMDDDTDCVLFDVRYEYPDGHSQPYPLLPFTRLSGEEAFRLSLDWQIHGVYLVRTALHRLHPYDEACRTYSDDNTTRLHFLSSRTVRRCGGTYHYRQHPASATHAHSVRRFDYLRANESMKQQLVQTCAPESVMCQWETIRLLNLVDLYMFYHCHASSLSPSERRYGLKEMRRVWNSLERNRIEGSARHKFGYRLMPSWPLFRLQEWAYFTLRGLAGRNK